MVNSYCITLGKCWQTPSNHMIWQAQIRPDGIKAYLKIDTERQMISLEKDRGADHPKAATAIFAALSRKYLKHAKIRHIYTHPKKGFYIPLGKFVLILKEEFLELIEETTIEKGISLVRHSVKGTYTHKKEKDIKVETEKEWQDLLPNLIDSYKDQLSDIIKSEEKSKEDKSLFQREAIRKITRKIRTVKEALEKTQKQKSLSNQLDNLVLETNLIKNYSYLIKDNELKIPKDLSPLETDLYININPDKQINQELQDRFLKIKKLKKSKEISTEREKKEQNFLNSLLEQKAKLEKELLSETEILDFLEKAQIQKHIHIKKNHQKEDISQERCFFSQFHPVTFLVGKTAKENDQLTKKAKSQDYWCHIVDGAGPHVIIKGAKQPIHQKIKKEAAILAIHFSRLRKDYSGEVYFTQKSYLKKKKSMPEGLWNVEKSEILFFRYDEKERKDLLDRKKNQSNS